MDQNGELDGQEIRIKHPEVTSEDLFDFFKNADADGSATVSLTEYTDFILKQS